MKLHLPFGLKEFKEKSRIACIPYGKQKMKYAKYNDRFENVRNVFVLLVSFSLRVTSSYSVIWLSSPS